jgi:hypothetical protein
MAFGKHCVQRLARYSDPQWRITLNDFPKTTEVKTRTTHVGGYIRGAAIDSLLGRIEAECGYAIARDPEASLHRLLPAADEEIELRKLCADFLSSGHLVQQSRYGAAVGNERLRG